MNEVSAELRVLVGMFGYLDCVAHPYLDRSELAPDQHRCAQPTTVANSSTIQYRAYQVIRGRISVMQK
jgi:hypothetical protein